MGRGNLRVRVRVYMGFHGLKTHEGYIQGSWAMFIPCVCNVHVNWHGNSSREVVIVVGGEMVVSSLCCCCSVISRWEGGSGMANLVYHNSTVTWHLFLMWIEGRGRQVRLLTMRHRCLDNMPCPTCQVVWNGVHKGPWHGVAILPSSLKCAVVVGGWLNDGCQRWWWLAKVVTRRVTMKVVVE